MAKANLNKTDKYVRALDKASTMDKSDLIIKGILMVATRDDELTPDEYEIILDAKDAIKYKPKSESKVDIRYHRPIVTRTYK